MLFMNIVDCISDIGKLPVENTTNKAEGNEKIGYNISTPLVKDTTVTLTTQNEKLKKQMQHLPKTIDVISSK